jgi:hypothetical protein
MKCMTPHDRALTIWIDITWAVLPPLVMLSFLLGWPSVVQIALTIVGAAAVFGTRFALTGREERRATRDARRSAHGVRERHPARRRSRA